MKIKFDVIFTNELDIKVFTDDFYQILFKNIVKLKKEKESKNHNTKIDKWDSGVCLSWYKSNLPFSSEV